MTVLLTDLRAVLVDARFRIDAALARIDADDYDVALNLVSGALIQLREARWLARVFYQIANEDYDAE